MDFDGRVAGLSALAEPARLRIVDLLGAGDASPGELRAELGLPSNLLAHHLKVLEDAGIVSRHRSHADKRRTYLRVHRGRLAGLLPAASSTAGAAAERVVFVCTANSARSQLAAARWNAISPIPAASAGTHPAVRVHPRATTTGRRHGLKLGRVKPVAMEQVVRDGDLVVAVCDNVHEELDPRRARLHWSIPDPARLDTDEAFETAYADITRRVERLAATVTAPAVGAEPS